ncbi:MAG TPA: 30S ribosomal protein S5 alanine N-acetyltransferase [Janthinobacterium sp.]|nr:30S ribosomal protein S5 alanine N-acetyltransferase [Janthinobacterium sp.]
MSSSATTYPAFPAFPADGLRSARLLLRPTTRADAAGLLAYHEFNRERFQRWEALRADAFFSRDAFDARCAEMERQAGAGLALSLLLLAPGDGAIVGECAFTNIVRGPLQACHLGFTIDARREGLGLMREALTAAIGHLFEHYGLHRVMAGHMPANERSGRLLARLGFEREGYARAYLKINGAWEDHVMSALIASKN